MKRSKLPFLATTIVLLFFYIPIVILVTNSFNASAFGSSWGGFTLKWYRKLASQNELLVACKNSLLIALTSSAIATVLGTLAAFALHRYRSTLQKVHYGLIYIPLVVPEILTGISLLLFFVAIGKELGLFTIFLAHVTFCISYVAMVVLARLQDFDYSVIEAARDLGARWWDTTWKVLIPLLAPGIIAGALLSFTLSIDDFVITFFVAGPGSTTLPIRIYSMIKHGSPALINVVSTLLIVLTAVIVFISQRMAIGWRKQQ